VALVLTGSSANGTDSRDPAVEDVTEAVAERLHRVPDLVERARATLAELDEPARPIGPHCSSPRPCPFIAHCRAN
jgi:hypothetical protein